MVWVARLVALGMMLAALPAAAQNPLVQQLDRSVVLVIAQPESGRGLGIGTGFFVAPGLIVTNRHVIEGAAAERIYVASRTLGAPRRVSVVARSASSRAGEPDFAVLRLTQVPDAARVLPLSRTVERLQEVVAAGYPGLVVMADADFRRMVEGDRAAVPEMALTSGEVTVTQTIAGGSVASVVHTAQISGGNSGGPLVDRCGRVVGVNTLVRTERSGGSGGRALTALKTDGLIAFLNENRIPFTEAQGACRTGQPIADAGSAGVRGQAAAPAAPIAAQAPPPAAAQPTLTGRFAPENSPLARANGIAQLQAYADGGRPNRALAFHPENLIWAAIDASTSAAEATRFALERCEFLRGAACALLELNGTMERPGPGGVWPTRPQASLNPTSETLVPDAVPFLTDQRRSTWLPRYTREQRPKALALHPSGEGAFRTGQLPEVATRAALEACREANAQRNPERCFLYAVGDRVRTGRHSLQRVREGR